MQQCRSTSCSADPHRADEGKDEIIDALSLREEYKVLKPKMHLVHPLKDDASAFSDPEYLWLERKEWFSVPFKLDMTEGEIQDDSDIPTMFHGTEWGAAIQIMQQNAFIIGQGTQSQGIGSPDWEALGAQGGSLKNEANASPRIAGSTQCMKPRSLRSRMWS